VLTANNIHFAYNSAPVLGDIALTARPGTVVGLIGPNGSGKSTLLRILYGGLAPRAGLVTLNEQPVNQIGGRELARQMAVVTQENATELPVTVAETVLLGRSPHRGALAAYTNTDHQLAASALHRVGARALADRSFADLSGGEKQRVLIARTLAQQADYLLLDEPTNHLDIRYQHQILDLVRTLKVATVVVLHDLNLAARYCDELILLDHGTIARSGPVDHVLDPDILQPIYGIGVRRVTDHTTIQLLFHPTTTEISPIQKKGCEAY
jgi:iron complex transport system ATP-binding protein